MPLEYVHSGRSMAPSIAAKSTMLSNRWVTWRLVRPSSVPSRNTFSRPDRYGLKARPYPKRLATAPRTVTRPSVAREMPATMRSSVVLPAPLSPTMPSERPRSRLNDTSRSAHIPSAARVGDRRRAGRISSQSRRRRVRYHFERPSASITAALDALTRRHPPCAARRPSGRCHAARTARRSGRASEQRCGRTCSAP